MNQHYWYKIDSPVFSKEFVDECERLFYFIDNNPDLDGVKKPFIGYVVEKSFLEEHGFDEILKLYAAYPHIESTRFMWTDVNDTSHGFEKTEYLPHIDSTPGGARYSAGIVMPLFGATKETKTKWYRWLDGAMDFDIRYTSFAYDPDTVRVREIDEATLENGQPYILNVEQLHGVKNSSGQKRVNVGWHFKQYLTWDDLMEYLNGQLYREDSFISKTDVEQVLQDVDVEKHQYFNTTVRVPNPGMRYDTYAKVSRYKETVDLAKDYLQNVRPELYIADGIVNDNYWIQYAEVAGVILSDWAKTHNTRQRKNATLLLSDENLHWLAQELRKAFDKNYPYVHRDANMWNIVVTDLNSLTCEFIDFDSFIRVDDYQQALDLYYNDMFHLFKHFSGWDNVKAKGICDVYYKQ